MKLDHVAINVRDLDQSLAFYVEWFEFDVIQRWQEPRQAFIGKPAITIGLIENTTYDFEIYTQAHIAFSVSKFEFDLWVKKVQDANLPVVSGPKPQRNGETFLFRDPSGNILEICYPELNTESN